MTVSEWNERYRSRTRADDFTAAPTPLLLETARDLPPGKALDLACGTGRQALWLAAQGWEVVAVDGAEIAIASLRARAEEHRLSIEARIADLTSREFTIGEARWDLILTCYYLQRDLLEPLKKGIVPGGLALVIVHIVEAGEEPTPTRLRRGELHTYFDDWQILHHYEGESRDPAHHRPVAEIVARRTA